MDRGLLFLLWVWFLLVGLVLLQLRDLLFTLLDEFHQPGNFILLLFTEFCGIGGSFDLGELLFSGWTFLFIGWNLLFTGWNLFSIGWNLRTDELILQWGRRSHWAFRKLVPDNVWETLSHLVFMSVHMIQLKVSPAADFILLELASHHPGEVFLYLKVSQVNSFSNLIKDDTTTHFVHLILSFRIGGLKEKGVCPFINWFCLCTSSLCHLLIKL